MFNWLQYDSPIYRKLVLLTNLMLANLLWLACCLPIVTIGASTAALYHVIFQQLTHQEDELLRPFFQAFRDNFRQATFIWIPHLLIGLALFLEGCYLYLSPSGLLWLIYGLLIVLFLGFSSFLYPLAARFQSSFRNILINAAALTCHHLMSACCMAVLNILPLVLLLFFPLLFWKTSLLWTFGGISLIAYLNGIILMRIFNHYAKEEQSEYEKSL